MERKRWRVVSEGWVSCKCKRDKSSPLGYQRSAGTFQADLLRGHFSTRNPVIGCWGPALSRSSSSAHHFPLFSLARPNLLLLLIETFIFGLLMILMMQGPFHTDYMALTVCFSCIIIHQYAECCFLNTAEFCKFVLPVQASHLKYCTH